LVDLTLKDDGRWQRLARGVDSLDDGNLITIPWLDNLWAT
jgi:hypothetical protein